MSVRITRRMSLVVVVIALGVLPATAGAGIRDGRSPDTKDAATLAHFDGRSPDTVDAAITAHETQPVVDLRSPDTRDAAVVAHRVPSPTIVIATNTGFDWTDAGIGAAGGFAVALLLAGTLALARNDRRDKLAL